MFLLLVVNYLSKGQIQTNPTLKHQGDKDLEWFTRLIMRAYKTFFPIQRDKHL